MDEAKQQAIQNCGRPGCGQPEDAHQHRTGIDPADAELSAILGGACSQFVVSDAAVIVQRHLAITNNREPQRRPGGPIGKRLPLHLVCGNRHHPGSCPLGVVPAADPAAASTRGAAIAREALGITRNDSAEAP